jgi:hypothetical protein
LYKEEFHSSYSSPNIDDKMGRTCSIHGDIRTAYIILVAKPEGKRPIERTILEMVLEK